MENGPTSSKRKQVAPGAAVDPRARNALRHGLRALTLSNLPDDCGHVIRRIKRLRVELEGAVAKGKFPEKIDGEPRLLKKTREEARLDKLTDAVTAMVNGFENLCKLLAARK